MNVFEVSDAILFNLDFTMKFQFKQKISLKTRLFSSMKLQMMNLIVINLFCLKTTKSLRI